MNFAPQPEDNLQHRKALNQIPDLLVTYSCILLRIVASCDIAEDTLEPAVAAVDEASDMVEAGPAAEADVDSESGKGFSNIHVARLLMA